MHAEVISMMGDILGNENAADNITTGGSESNFCAMLTAKSKALSTGKSKPRHNGSIVLPKTAHYSFFKGCHMFDLEPIVVDPIPGTIYKIDPKDMRKAVREDTIAIVATAGTYPYGTVEPIEEIGEIAEEKDLYFHIDVCFGGFILLFLEKGGYKLEIPKWDFRVKSISSIAADVHKNGMVPPPASCIIYRNEELLNFAKKMLRPKSAVTGTRAAGPIAASWTMLNLLGLEGYIAISKKSMELKEVLEDGVRQIPGLRVVPDSKINLALIYSDEYDLMPVIEQMRKNGWIFSTATYIPPIDISAIIMPQNDGQIEAFVDDLKKNMKFADPIKSKAEMKIYGPEYPMIY
jgi:glutamate/tyrosine decarboxylase-like PLP-dependent enzyme